MITWRTAPVEVLIWQAGRLGAKFHLLVKTAVACVRSILQWEPERHRDSCEKTLKTAERVMQLQITKEEGKAIVDSAWAEMFSTRTGSDHAERACCFVLIAATTTETSPVLAARSAVCEALLHPYCSRLLLENSFREVITHELWSCLQREHAIALLRRTLRTKTFEDQLAANELDGLIGAVMEVVAATDNDKDALKLVRKITSDTHPSNLGRISRRLSKSSQCP